MKGGRREEGRREWEAREGGREESICHLLCSIVSDCSLIDPQHLAAQPSLALNSRFLSSFPPRKNKLSAHVPRETDRSTCKLKDRPINSTVSGIGVGISGLSGSKFRRANRYCNRPQYQASGCPDRVLNSTLPALISVNPHPFRSSPRD